MSHEHERRLGRPGIVVSALTELDSGAATIELTLADGEHYRHWFAAVSYYNSAEVLVTPGAGTEVYTVDTPLRPGVYQSIVNGSHNSAAVEQADWASPTTKVKVVLASVTTATHVRLRAVGVIS